MGKTTISIIIPVKNGIETIGSCLAGIMKQSIFDQCEIIIIDSGSTDGTLNRIKEFPVKLYEIPPHEFNHGSTRNYGVSLAKGEFVVMTVQDATPIGTLWLETMYHHFIDSQIAGVCGQQIVPHHKDKNPHKWFRPINMPYVNTIQKDTMPMDYIPRGWDNVNAMYRKDILLEIPFRSVAFGEDFLWASDAYNANYKLVFDSNSKVEHYHHATSSYVYNRVTTELYF
jgi:rhamnosyltransferase